MQHSHPTLTFKPVILFPPTLYLLPLHPHHPLMLLAVSLYLLLSLPLHNSLRVLQWNAGGLQARSTKLLHFISSDPVGLIYIQESNLNLSSSFRIPGFSALQSHGTHSRSGTFSTDVADASGGVIIFVKQGLFFSKLSTSSLSLLGLYSDYVEINISLNDSSSLSLLNVYAPPIRSFTKDSRTNLFSFSILPSYVEAEAVDFSRFRFHRKSTASSSSFRFHIPALNYTVTANAAQTLSANVATRNLCYAANDMTSWVCKRRLSQGFITEGKKHQSKVYEMRCQNNGYFKLFAKNLFSILFKIRKHFPKPFLTSAFLNDFCHKKELL